MRKVARNVSRKIQDWIIWHHHMHCVSMVSIFRAPLRVVRVFVLLLLLHTAAYDLNHRSQPNPNPYTRAAPSSLQSVKVADRSCSCWPSSAHEPAGHHSSGDEGFSMAIGAYLRNFLDWLLNMSNAGAQHCNMKSTEQLNRSSHSGADARMIGMKLPFYHPFSHIKKVRRCISAWK